MKYIYLVLGLIALVLGLIIEMDILYTIGAFIFTWSIANFFYNKIQYKIETKRTIFYKILLSLLVLCIINTPFILFSDNIYLTCLQFLLSGAWVGFSPIALFRINLHQTQA
jgi:hypothetical protein